MYNKSHGGLIYGFPNHFRRRIARTIVRLRNFINTTKSYGTFVFNFYRWS